MNVPVQDPSESLPGVGRLFSESWTLYKARLWDILVVGGLGGAATLAAAFLPVLAGLILSFWVSLSLWSWVLIGAISLSAALWLGSWAQVAVIELILDPKGGRGAADCYRASWGKIAIFSWVCVLYLVLTAGGFFLFLMPGLFLGVALSFAPLISVDQAVDAWQALLKSLSYVKGRYFAALGRLLLLTLAASLPAKVPVIGPILGALAAPFAMVGMATLYRSLKSTARPQAAAPGAGPKLLLAGAVLGFVLPVYLTAKVAPAFKSLLPALKDQADFLFANPPDAASGQRIVTTLQEGAFMDRLSLYGNLINTLQGRAAALPLLAQLKSDSPEARLEAAERLAELGDPTTAQALADAMLTQDPRLRAACRKALDRLGVSPASFPAVAARVDSLLRELGGADLQARRNAIKALGDLGDPRAAEALEKLEAQGSQDDSALILESLKKLGRPAPEPKP